MLSGRSLPMHKPATNTCVVHTTRGIHRRAPNLSKLNTAFLTSKAAEAHRLGAVIFKLYNFAVVSPVGN